jgi:hypothetical protein
MRPKTDHALAHLGQIATDFAGTLPVSARGPFVQAAQQAFNDLDAKLCRLADLEAQAKSTEINKTAPPAGGEAAGVA